MIIEASLNAVLAQLLMQVIATIRFRGALSQVVADSTEKAIRVLIDWRKLDAFVKDFSEVAEQLSEVGEGKNISHCWGWCKSH